MDVSYSTYIHTSPYSENHIHIRLTLHCILDMFTRFRVCSKQVASLASILGASLCLKKFNCDINNPVNHDSDQVVILLSEVSKQSINDHLATLGHSKLISDPKVVISNNPDSKTLRRLVPAFGERVSFRLQGLMTVDDTNTAVSLYVLSLSLQLI